MQAPRLVYNNSSDRSPLGFISANSSHQDDLTSLNIAAGQCVNTTVKQDVTFGLQGLPFGIDLGDGKKGEGNAAATISACGVSTLLGAMMGVALQMLL